MMNNHQGGLDFLWQEQVVQHGSGYISAAASAARPVYPLFFGVICLCITSTPLHPITDVVQGLLSNISLASAWRGSSREAVRISSDVMAWLRAMGVRTTTSTPGTLFCGKKIGPPSSSNSGRSTSGSLELAMRIGEGLSTAVWAR